MLRSHLRQGIQRFLLMVLEFQLCAIQRLATLLGQIVLNRLELRMITEEDS